MSLAYLVLLALIPASLGSHDCDTDADCGTGFACCLHRNGNNSECYDPRYQSCCRNAVCLDYQHCCNATCCSGRESCRTRETLDGDFDTCSSIEYNDAARHFVSFGIPITLGIGAIIAYIFALALVRAHRVRFTAPVAVVLASSFFCWIWGILLLISMHATPAFLICAVTAASVASLAAIAPAHAPTQVLVVTAAAVAATFLMMINPFASNSLFSFAPAYRVYVSGMLAGADFGGVLGRAVSVLSPAALQNANNDDGTIGAYSCPGWYNGYWRRDYDLYSDTRVHDPYIIGETKGLCGRQYLAYIAVIATFETAGLPILFLALIARLWEVRGASRAERVVPEVPKTEAS